LAGVTSWALLTLRAAAVVALVGLGVVALAWAGQRRLIYLASARPAPPADAVLAGSEDVLFLTEDGLRLAGWFVPAAPGRDTGRTVLMLNGNAGDRSDRAPFAEAMAGSGVSVLLFDYRGYAGNPGHPTETGLAADARAARDYLASRPDVRSDSIVYFGESLGAAVAIRLAVERPPAGLVLRSPFTALADVGRLLYPFLPVRLLLKDRYDAIGRIGSVGCPLLVVAGAADGIVPASHSRRLYDAARQPKRYVEIPGAGHNDWALLAGDQLIRETLVFITP
jgi:fermentation-respiration switch protein FrsA (DUF1100 family)